MKLKGCMSPPLMVDSWHLDIENNVKTLSEISSSQTYETDNRTKQKNLIIWYISILFRQCLVPNIKQIPFSRLSTFGPFGECASINNCITKTMPQINYGLTRETHTMLQTIVYLLYHYRKWPKKCLRRIITLLITINTCDFLHTQWFTIHFYKLIFII